jgi:hypothetical protein
MMKDTNIPSSGQHLSAGQSLHLHLNAGDALQIISGHARMEQPLWIAERMLMQRSRLSAGQLHRCEQSGWVSLTSLSALEFTQIASAHRPKALYHATQRIWQLRTWLTQWIHRKTQHAK